MTRKWLQLRTAAVLVALAAAHTGWGLTQVSKRWHGVESLPARTIDLATASWPELAWLPGVGAQTAQQIARERARLGVPLHLGNLASLPSVGEGTVNAIPVHWLERGQVEPDWSRHYEPKPNGGIPPPE